MSRKTDTDQPQRHTTLLLPVFSLGESEGLGEGPSGNAVTWEKILFSFSILSTLNQIQTAEFFF